MLQQRNKFLKLFFLVDIIGLAVIIFCIILTRTNIHNDFAQGNFSNISGEWYLDTALAEPATLENLGEKMNEEIGKISVYSRIPDIDVDTALIYRTKDVSSRVLIEGREVYETNPPKSPFYNISPGNIWNKVIISASDTGKLMEIEITMAYDTNAITLDHTFFGNEIDIVLGLIQEKTTALIVSIFLCMIGILFIFLNYTVIFAQNKTSMALFYLGIYAISTGIWSILETNVIQFFVQDSRILQLVDNMAMLAGNIPLFLYLDESHKILDKKFVRFLCYMDLAYITACIVLQFIPGYDVHFLIAGASIFTIIFTGVYVFFFLQMAFVSFYKKQKTSIETNLQMIGLVILLVTVSMETINYQFVMADGMDRAENIRLAMLFLIIIWGFSSQLQMIRLIKQGMQYDLVSKMAYTDILTDLGNRTAYLECLQKFENSNKAFGIVFLDINNLKMVNDNYGHDQGDMLIQMAANVIANSFGKVGTTYRIGGDEFCVLIDGKECQKLYEDSLNVFQQEIVNANKSVPQYLKLQIAQGFSVCLSPNANAIAASVDAADVAMYANKKMLKSGALKA